MRIEPLFDNILVRVEKRPEMSEGGLHLPSSRDDAADEPEKGTIIAVGPGRPEEKDGLKRPFVPMILKVDDVVLFSKYAGSDVKLNGEKLLLMSEQAVLGVVRDEV